MPGKMQINYIRIPPADKVQVELVPMTTIQDVSLAD
jgi:translation initiation factor IF-1